jgi:peptidoglycan/LPS O-acetylase OafA/YrhL
MKIAGIQTLRGIAANFVIFFHCLAIGLLPKYGFQTQFESFTILRNFWSGVDLFFCVSGFVMCYSYLNSELSGWDFFRARVLRIVPIYWIFTTLTFVTTIVMGSSADYKWFLQSLLFFVDLENRAPILAVGWTLQYEMFFYLLFAIAISFFRQNRFYFLCATLLIITIIKSYHNIVLEFVFGGIAYLLYTTDFFKRFKFIIFGFFSGLYMMSLFVLKENIASNYRVIFFGIPSLFIVASLANMNMPKHSLQKVGGFSYSLYLIHFPLLSIYFKIISLYDFRFFPSWLLIVVAVGSCNTAAFITWKYLEIPVTRFLKNRFFK